MKNLNIGIVNLMLSNKLKDSYFTNTLIEESKEIISDFFNVVKNSPLLQLEFNVFNNLDNKHIDDEVIATRYIDNNIKLFDIYTIEEIDKEREKLLPFIDENKIPLNNKKVELYNAIDTLIEESLKDYNDVDVDAIHESFVIVLNHIKTPSKKINENLDIDMINEDIIEIAINKFNKKYETLNENDRILIQRLSTADEKDKEKLLETFKNETLLILEGLYKEMSKENIAKAIEKIKTMAFNPQKVDDDIISLYTLKKELL